MEPPPAEWGPPPPPLPLGWIAVWDETYGRYYYWNAETRTSVWVPPVPPPVFHSCHKQTQHVREAEGTIASDGAQTWKIQETWKTAATIHKIIEDMPFVPCSGHSSLIQKESKERLVDPQKILQPTINKLDLTPCPPQARPIKPPTGQRCVHREFWEQLESPPQDQTILEDQKILQTMD